MPHFAGQPVRQHLPCRHIPYIRPAGEFRNTKISRFVSHRGLRTSAAQRRSRRQQLVQPPRVFRIVLLIDMPFEAITRRLQFANRSDGRRGQSPVAIKKLSSARTIAGEARPVESHRAHPADSPNRSAGAASALPASHGDSPSAASATAPIDREMSREICRNCCATVRDTAPPPATAGRDRKRRLLASSAIPGRTRRKRLPRRPRSARAAFP